MTNQSNAHIPAQAARLTDSELRYNYVDAQHAARRWDRKPGYESTWARYMEQVEIYRAEMQRRGLLVGAM